MTTNLVSQAATMELGGVPNDVIHNLNPFTLLMYVDPHKCLSHIPN